MTETLSFPGLGLEFHLNPIIFPITGTWAVRWYGVIITLGIILGVGYCLRRAKTFGLDQDRMLDVYIGGILGGMVGARLYYVIFQDWATYRHDLLRILRTWEGGIAIYGGVIGGVVAGLLLCRWRKVKPLPALDASAGGLLLGQAIGRWGNFVNIEAFGSNTTAPWGMTGPSIQRYLAYRAPALAEQGIVVDPMMPVHPTFFYESVWCLAGFLFLAWFTTRRRYDGQLALLYIGWYGLGRFWIEGLRTDSLMLGSIRISQALALACVIVSAAAMLLIQFKRGANPERFVLYADTEAGKAMWAEAPANTTQAPDAFKKTEGATPVPPRNRPLRGAKKMADARNPKPTRKRGLHR